MHHGRMNGRMCGSLWVLHPDQVQPWSELACSNIHERTHQGHSSSWQCMQGLRALCEESATVLMTCCSSEHSCHIDTQRAMAATAPQCTIRDWEHAGTPAAS